MVSLDLRKAWAEAAYKEYFREVGRDFCPSLQSFNSYLQGFFAREAFGRVTADNLSQYYTDICDALELDFPNKDVAQPLYNALQRHALGEINIPHMKLQICDGATP
ncbi:MAG: hypothetical protein HRT94_00585 [Alphaproteobacteria bacterium]|nr:hypothetical protein [Alphaproteobacteria bacterium]